MKVEVAVLGPNKPYGFCARRLKLTLFTELRSRVKEEVGVPGLPVPNGLYGLRGSSSNTERRNLFQP